MENYQSLAISVITSVLAVAGTSLLVRIIVRSLEVKVSELVAAVVASIAAVIIATLVGGYFGLGSVIQYIPYLDFKVDATKWELSVLVSAVTALVTLIGWKFHTVTAWIPLHVLVGLVMGISLGTNVGVAAGILKIETAALIATGAAVATIVSSFLLRLTMQPLVEYLVLQLTGLIKYLFPSSFAK